MIDLFEDTIDLKSITCHSGGAIGSDQEFENVGKEFCVKTRAYSYRTKYHTSPNKIEISDEDFREGVNEINKANKHIGRFGIQKYMNLLARNWAQVKYSTQIFAVGVIVESGGKTPEGYYSKSKIQTVSGGTGYSVMMGILHTKDVFVFDQIKDKWFRWSYTANSFIELKETPKIKTQNFAGIGTRKLNDCGRKAIRELYEKTFQL